MITLALLLAAALAPARAAEEDPFLWLEDVQSPRAMEWVKAQNQKSVGRLTSDRRYKKIEQESRAILTAKDRLAFPSLRNGWVYNFWQDEQHLRGLWRRTRPEDYAKEE